MPDKPSWAGSLDQTIEKIAALPCPEVDSGLLAELLGLKRRRVQQILEPLVGRTVGRSYLVAKEVVIRHLRSMVSEDMVEVEKQRKARLFAQLAGSFQPKVLVEAPAAIVRQQFQDLPPGIGLAPGRIVLEGFRTVEQAQQQILALIMALGNDPEGFAELVRVD